MPVVPEVVGGGTNVQGAAATSENAGAATTAGIGSASVPDGTAALRVTLSFGEKGQRLYWNAEAGATYQVQASTNLVAWTNLGPTRVATEPNESLTVNVSGPAAFYRLIRVR